MRTGSERREKGSHQVNADDDGVDDAVSPVDEVAAAANHDAGNDDAQDAEDDLKDPVSVVSHFAARGCCECVCGFACCSGAGLKKCEAEIL